MRSGESGGSPVGLALLFDLHGINVFGSESQSLREVWPSSSFAGRLT